MAKCEPYASIAPTEHSLREELDRQGKNQKSNTNYGIRKQIINWWVECIYREDDTSHDQHTTLFK